MLNIEEKMHDEFNYKGLDKKEEDTPPQMRKRMLIVIASFKKYLKYEYLPHVLN